MVKLQGYPFHGGYEVTRDDGQGPQLLARFYGEMGAFYAGLFMGAVGRELPNVTTILGPDGHQS